jgi:hypothetical protein
MLFVTAALVAVLVAYYRSATRVEYGKTTKQHEVLPPPPNMNQTTGRDTRTERAIEEAQRLTAGNASTPHPGGAPGRLENIDKNTNGETPFTVPPAAIGTNATVDPTNTGTNNSGNC